MQRWGYVQPVDREAFLQSFEQAGRGRRIFALQPFGEFRQPYHSGLGFHLPGRSQLTCRTRGRSRWIIIPLATKALLCRTAITCEAIAGFRISMPVNASLSTLFMNCPSTAAGWSVCCRQRGHRLPRFRPAQKSSIIQTLLVFRQRIKASSRESGDGMAVSPKSPVWRQITRALAFRSTWTIRASGPLSTETNKPSPLLVHDTGPTAGHPLASRNVRRFRRNQVKMVASL